MISSVLNNGVAIADVLRECGTAARAVPGFCRCPICRQDTLYVTRLADEAGGWYQCQGRCGFVGDSLELLAAREDREQGEFLRARRLQDSSLYSPDNISKHIEEVKRRQAMQAAWRKVSDRSSLQVLAGPEVSAILADYRLAPHARAGYWDSRLAPLFGACTGAQAAGLFPNRGLKPLPGPGGKAWLLTPLFAAPGLMLGLAGFDYGPRAAHYYAKPERDALLFLDRPYRPTEPVVHAFGDARFAVALHVLAQNNHGRQPPVVAYVPDSDAAWRHVQSRKVILWSPDPGLEIFVQARRIGDRALVSRLPGPADPAANPFEHYRGETPNQALARLEAAAEPWLKALKDHIVACAGSAVLEQIALRLALTPREAGIIRGYCATAEERRILDAVYEAGPIVQLATTTRGGRVVQKADGWYRVVRGGEHALLSEATAVVESQTVSTAATVFAGHVRVRNDAGETVFPFRVDRRRFNCAWLREACAAAGQYARIGNFDLEDVAAAFHRPVTLRALDRLGWDPDAAAFVYPPGAILANGTIDDTPRQAERPHPLDRLACRAPFDPALVREWFGRPDYADYWRVYLAGLYNHLAPALGRPPLAVGVYGAGAAGLAAAAARDLYGETLPPGEPDKVLAAARAHAVPVWVTARGPETAALVKTPGLTNVVVALDSEETARLAQMLGWAVVVGAEPEGPAPENAGGVLGALLVQHQLAPADPELPPFQAALETLKGWLRRTFEEPAPILRNILEYVRAPDESRAGAGGRALEIVKQLLRSGQLSVRRGPELPTGAPPPDTHLTSAGDAIYVPEAALRRALARTGMADAIATRRLAADLAAIGALRAPVTCLGSTAGWWVAADRL
jgi:hypothetical protein